MSFESGRFELLDIPTLDELALYVVPGKTVYHTSLACWSLSNSDAADEVRDPLELKSVFRNRERCSCCDPSGVLFFSRGGKTVHKDRNCQGLARVSSFRPVWGQAARNAESCYDACGYCTGYERYSGSEGGVDFQESAGGEQIDYSAVVLDE